LWFMHLLHTEISFFDFFVLHIPFFLQAVCTMLAMIATLPLVQLFFFHILLIKKVSFCNCSIICSP
jgi:hypothetical protein